MPRRSPESLADYLAVAICPALIMLLVGSLVFFLIEVFYQGQYGGRLLFVMAMFVMAIVGIARISIEQDVGYASLYALPLAGVVLMAMSHFVTIEGPLASISLLVNGSFMAIVWWSAHKLTWDCTLIDDTQDASGNGLLQEMGLDPSSAADAGVAPGLSTRAGEVEAVTGADRAPERPWWERWFENDRRPHAPGVWVVYFSLAALPLFGFGGWFVPSGDAAARSRVFQLLVVYVGSGLALLLATSFLGLRRYLRQRRLEMPLEMTATWLALGLALIAATLAATAILPRPRAEYSLTQLPVAFTSAVRRASQFAAGKEGTEDKSKDRATTSDVQEGQQAEEQGSKSGGKSGEMKEKSDSGSSASEQAKGKSGDSQKSGEDSKSGKRGSKSKDAKEPGESADDSSKDNSRSSQQDDRSGEKSSQLTKQEPVPPATNETRPAEQESLSQMTSQVMQGVNSVLRWLFYGALAAAALAFGWIYRAELLAAWHKLLAELRELWTRWFGVAKPKTSTSGVVSPSTPPRPFASFSDPFASGTAGQMPWPVLVRYTFEAVEAWGRERDATRKADQTAHEFAATLARLEPRLSAPVQSLAAWYSQLAYAPRAGSGGSPEALQQLWRILRATSAPPKVLRAD